MEGQHFHPLTPSLIYTIQMLQVVVANCIGDLMKSRAVAQSSFLWSVGQRCSKAISNQEQKEAMQVSESKKKNPQTMEYDCHNIKHAFPFVLQTLNLKQMVFKWKLRVYVVLK